MGARSRVGQFVASFAVYVVFAVKDPVSDGFKFAALPINLDVFGFVYFACFAVKHPPRSLSFSPRLTGENKVL